MINQEQTYLPDHCSDDCFYYLPEITSHFIVGDRESSGTHKVRYDKLRIIIGGLSKSFNNIFMGIWGNTSLIHMHEHASDAVRKSIRQIEQLIHHGSVLIHIVCGYLAERNTAVRHIRLNQMLQQINEMDLSKDGLLDYKTNKSDMLWVARLRNPIWLVRSISQVVEKQLDRIEKKLWLVMAQAGADATIQTRLMKIDVLIKRGFALVSQLKQYTGDSPMVMRRMHLKSLIKFTLNQFELCRYKIRLKIDLSTPLPEIVADRLKLSNVLKHLIFNAIDAMPKGGCLTIATSLLSDAGYQESLFTHPGIDYLVIAVSDSGEGIAPQDQSKIFDPFYVGFQKPHRIGLGLSVSRGIVKAHGGYIQVSSQYGRGSTFRVYLPCPLKKVSRYSSRNPQEPCPKYDDTGRAPTSMPFHC